MPRALDILRRLIAALCGGLLAISGLWLFLHAFALVSAFGVEVPGGTLRLSLAAETVPTRLTYAAAGVALVFGGLLLVVVAVARAVSQAAWVTLEHRKDKVTGNSTVRLSRRALRGLTARMVEALPGIEASESALVLTRKGWQVVCSVYVSPDAVMTSSADDVPHGASQPSLPSLLAEVERTLRRGLEAQTGHPVAHLEVRAQITPFNPKERVL